MSEFCTPFDNAICPEPGKSDSDWGGMAPPLESEPARQLGSLGGTQMATGLRGAPAPGKFDAMPIAGSSRP